MDGWARPRPPRASAARGRPVDTARVQYRHAPAAHHGDLDAVLASAPGRPSLPVRLTLELFGRCREHLGVAGPAVVWDPCCGTGQLLATLGLLRGDAVAGLVGTDADPEPLALAARNLALLDAGGPDARAAELDALATRHGKPAYARAADAARRMTSAERVVPYVLATADAFDPDATTPVVAPHAPRIVMADMPYGHRTTWADASGSSGSGMVAALAGVLEPDAVIAVVARARRVPLSPGTPVLERVRAGHRAAVLVRAGDLS